MDLENQKGIAQVIVLLIIVSILGIVSFVLITSFAPIKNNALNTLNPKKESLAATTSLAKLYTIGGNSVPIQYQLISKWGSSSDGRKLISADSSNNRVVIFNTIPVNSNAVPDVVLGQVDFFHISANQGGTVGANTLNNPLAVLIVGGKLLIADTNNSRVLIYNFIPTVNNAPADVVICQVDFNNGGSNQSGAVGANTLSMPYQTVVIGGKLTLADSANNRVLIYNSIPTTNNTPANLVIGQPDLTHNGINQGLIAETDYTLSSPFGLATNGTNLYIADKRNGRIQIFNALPSTNNASANSSTNSGQVYSLNYYGGLLYVSASSFTSGIEVYGNPPPTPVPTASTSITTTATPAAASCPLGSLGDLNCDGKINLFDYSILITIFGKHL